MKRILITATPLILLFLILSCRQWEVPSELTGEWVSKEKVKVRTREHGKYRFIQAPDSISLQIIISKNGEVIGKLGGAEFEACKLKNQWNHTGIKMGLPAHYVIKGKLHGAIFTGDPYITKQISIPFDVDSNKMDGSIFQIYTLDLFPISSFEPIKK